MALQRPVCLQCIQRCATSVGKDNCNLQRGDIAVQADSLLITDIKSVPILSNLVSTFDHASPENISVHANLQVHVIPSSYKIGCSPKSSQMFDKKGNEILKLLMWCHFNVKGIKVYSPNMNHCQAAYLQALAASLSSQSVIVSSESFTSGFNGLGVLTLYESIINCEQLIFGKPLLFTQTRIIGVEIVGCLSEFTVSTDLVLQFIKFIRPLKDCIIEVWGSSLHLISLSDRITIANMVKETNANCIFFPCDNVCAAFLKATSSLMFEDKKVILSKEIVDVSIARSYDKNYIFDLSAIHTSISGPKREIDRISLTSFASEFRKSIYAKASARSYGLKVQEECDPNKQLHGSIVGVSLAGCTNSSNAFVTLQAGLIAKNLIDNGCKLPKCINGFYATGAGLADLYLNEAGLSDIFIKFGMVKSVSCCVYQDKTACQLDNSQDIITCALLSGNGNYENRKFPGVKANFLMSSPLALLYAAFGNVNFDLSNNILSQDDGTSLKISDIWPDRKSLIDLECKHVLPNVCYTVFKEFSSFGSQSETINLPFKDTSFPWTEKSLYITRPPYLDMDTVLGDMNHCRILLSVGDNISSEIISPSGSMGRNSTAAHYLASKGLSPRQFDSYGNRRGNHTIVAMGVFNNTKLQNSLVPMKGPYTLHIPSNSIVDIYEAAMLYKDSGTPTIILAGSNYGHGPVRDSGARGVRLLGVSAVVARSFHDSHRRELINQGVMPVTCEDADCVDPTCEITIRWTHVRRSDVSCDVTNSSVASSLNGTTGEVKTRGATSEYNGAACSSNSSGVSDHVTDHVTDASYWEGTLSWASSTSPRVRCQGLPSLNCSGAGVKVRLAAYNQEEMDLLKCGGLLKWRIRDLTERAERMRAEKAAQLMESSKFNNGLNPHPSPLPVQPIPPFTPVITPGYSAYPPVTRSPVTPGIAPGYSAYPPVAGSPVVQYIPVLQYLPMTYDNSIDMKRLSLSHHSTSPFLKN